MFSLKKKMAEVLLEGNKQANIPPQLYTYITTVCRCGLPGKKAGG